MNGLSTSLDSNENVEAPVNRTFKMSSIFQDWRANAGNKKAQLVLLAFRVAQSIRRSHRPIYLLGAPYLVFYRVTIEWMLCIELPWNTQVGPGLRLFHGMGLVVNDQTVIGRNVVLRHTTAIGVKETLHFGTHAAPIIGDDVDISAHVVISAPINVGRGVRINAGSGEVSVRSASATHVSRPAQIVHLNAMLGTSYV